MLSSLRKWLSPFGSAARPARRSPRRVSPQLEALEDRTVPAGTGRLTFLEVLQEAPAVIPGAKVVPGLEDNFAVTVSPDGRNVYVGASGSESLLVFDRDPGNGRLTFREWFTDEDVEGGTPVDTLRPRSVAVSPDGRNVYTANFDEDTLSVFSRNITSGRLTFQDYVQDNADDNAGNPVDGLDNTSGVVVSPDGRHVYATSENDNAVSVFARDQQTGQLTFVEYLQDGGPDAAGNPLDGLEFARALSISADGKNVYVTSVGDAALNVFRRNATTGQLTFVQKLGKDQGGVTVFDFPNSVTVSPDGMHVYTADKNRDLVAVFQRNAATGRLTFVNALGGGATNVLDGARRIQVSPDGQHAYVAAEDSNALAVFARNPSTGLLSLVQVYQDADSPTPIPGATRVPGLAQNNWLDLSPDGRNVYAVTRLDTMTVFARDVPTPPQPPAQTDRVAPVVTSARFVPPKRNARRAAVVPHFSEPLDSRRVQDLGNYLIGAFQRGAVWRSGLRVVAPSSVAYDSQARTVTVYFQLKPQDREIVVNVNGEPNSGLADLAGNFLDGNGRGGTDAFFTFNVRRRR